MIIVSSYPKSGATWFQFLIYACYNGEISASKEVINFYPPINRSKIIEERDIKFIKSHHRYSNDLPYLNDITKSIYLVRHPLDVMLSQVNHHIHHGSIRLLLKKGKIKYYQQYLEDNKILSPNSWSAHVQSWLDQAQIPLIIIKYEDLLASPFETLSLMNSDYNLGLKEQNIKAAIKFAHFTKMKEIEHKEMKNKTAGLFYSKRRKITNKLFKTRFINKGQADTYKEILKPEMITNAQYIFKQWLDRLNYHI